MDIIQYQHQTDYFCSKLLDRYFGPMKLGIFDIETLGLNPVTSKVILAGIMHVTSDGNCHMTQYFAEEEEDEKDLLIALSEEFLKYEYLLTYNGKHFDIPFIEKRARANGLYSYPIDCYNLDLYLILNGHSPLKGILPNLKQKTVEEYMGLQQDRRDEISGAESVRLYNDFAAAWQAKERKALKNRILLHNHDDLFQLYKILPIIQKTDFHRAMSYLGFPVQGQNLWPRLNISKVKIDISGFTIQGTYCGPEISYLSYDTEQRPYSCRFQKEGTFRFLLAVDRHKGNAFINLKHFLSNYDKFREYPNYVNGFLLLIQDGRTHFMEMNEFAKAFLQQFMETTACPLP